MDGLSLFVARVWELQRLNDSLFASNANISTKLPYSVKSAGATRQQKSGQKLRVVHRRNGNQI